MSQVRDNVLGLPVESGSAFFVKEAASSESGAASISQIALQTSKFVGAQARCEYLMPQMTQLNWALRAFENKIPDCRLLFDQAMQTPDPRQAIELFDELVRTAVGSVAAPCLRVIPAYAIMQNAYKSAESIQDSLEGKYYYDGYISVNPKTPNGPQLRPITADDLAYAGHRIAGQWQTRVDSEDLYHIGRLDEIITMYDRSNLANVGDDLRAEDMTSLLRAIGVVGAEPDWMAGTDVRVDPDTGALLFNGAPLTDANAIAPFFPPRPAGMMPYHGGRRHISVWAAQHNAAMLERPAYNQVEHVAPDDFLPRLGGNVADQSIVLRNIDGSTSSIFPQAGYPLRNVSYEVFRLTFNGVTEYMIINRAAGLTVNTMRSQAWHAWLNHHGGIANANSGSKTANDILAIRQKMGYQNALVPAYRELLMQLRASLARSSAPAVREIIGHMQGVENIGDNEDLAWYMATLGADIRALKPQLPKLTDLKASSLTDLMLNNGYTVIGSGRYGPTQDRVTALVPVIGRGVTPVRYRRQGSTLVPDDPNARLDIAVVLEEPPATVYSPVKTMLCTALLYRLVGYLNGQNTPAGYNFDAYDPANPFGVGQVRPSPHALLNGQLDRYEQALVHVIENAEVEQMPDLLKQIQQLVDARYFLAHIDEVISSVMLREDWIYMLQSLILGCVIEDGATVRDSAMRDVVSLYPGTVPREAAEFLFGTVLQEIKGLPAYDEVVRRALDLGVQGPVDLQQAANMDRVIRAEVLFERAVNGLTMLKSLLDGSNALVKNIHARGIQSLIDADLALELVQALETVLNRDYLGLVDKVEFEAPWDCAEWTTQFAAFAVSVRSHPIAYEIVDVAAEAAADSGLAAVTSALARVGFSWREIAPRALRVRGADQSAITIGGERYMAGQPNAGAAVLYNDAPVSKQALKITTICPSYDVEAYNLVKAYLTMNTSRTYFAQAVGRDISDRYSIRLSVNVDDRALSAILGSEAPAIRQTLHTHGIVVEKTPALANVALILPYVANYLQAPAITRDVYVPQIMTVDTEKSLAMTSGVTLMPPSGTDAFSPTNGLAVTVAERRSVSTALPWVGA